jgi:glycosyltransferase involved in cell wall biosynthesis
MYLLVSDVPIYLEGDRPWLRSSWRRSLVLLRESLGDRLGRVTVLAPTLPLDGAARDGAGDPSQALEPVEASDGLRLVPSIDLRGRTKTYWTRDRARWRSDVRAWVSKARAVHSGPTELWRPLAFEGFREARREGRPTIFELDDDVVARREERTAEEGPLARLGAQVFGTLFEGMSRYAARTADLTLLEAGMLVRRYGAHARSARVFRATAYRAGEVVPARALDDRLRARSPGEPLRVVSWGPLDGRAGLDGSIDAVRLARQRGAAITLDLLGDGPERRRLESRIAALGLRAAVRLLGPPPAGASLLRRLGDYDALLFTGASETPPTIFDGFAAGLPLVGFATDALREEGGAAVTVHPGDVGAVARALEELGRDRERLARMSRAAHRAGLHHAADAWHRRRAEWTLEAVLRHEAGSRARARAA